MKIDLQALAMKIRLSTAWKDGERIVILPKALIHEIQDELIRLYKLEAAVRRNQEIEGEIDVLTGRNG